MGTYLDYFGDPTIPEEKREEFTQRVLTILDQGGMLDLEDVSLFGKRVWLLKPPQALPGKDIIPFCYNYFEQDSWESAGYEPVTCRFHTNKVGRRQFNLVCSAVYVLYEFYTDTFGIANEDDHVYEAWKIIGWLNYLFGSRYDNRRVCDPWRIYQLLPDYRRDDDLLSLLPVGTAVDPLGMLIYLTVTRAEHEAEWKQLIQLSASEPDTVSVLDCMIGAEKALKEAVSASENPDAELLEQLIAALNAGDSSCFSEHARPQRCFTGMATLLPVELTAKLLADAFDQDFWAMLEKLRPSDRNARSFWNLVCQPAKPVVPVDTALFLRCSDDDRAWWWRPDGNVRFSEEMNAWLAQCRSSLETLAREEAAMHGTKLLELLIGTLDDIQKRYRSLFAFREMFYDFMAHGESPMVQAAVRFLKQMAEQEEDCTVFLRRYLAVLGNLPLRKKVFGF